MSSLGINTASQYTTLRGGFRPSSLGETFFQAERGSMEGNVLYSKTGDSLRDLQPRYVRHLNGSTQYGVVPDNALFDITDNLTVIVVAQCDTAELSGTNYLISKYTSAGNQREWALTINTDEKISVPLGDPLNGGFEGAWESDAPITPNTVNTLAFTFSGGTVVLYVNGVEVSGSIGTGFIPASLFNGTSDIVIGAIGNGGAYTDGVVSEALILEGASTVPTSAEMLDIYNSMRANPTKDIQQTVYGLAGQTVVEHWKLDENTGDIFYGAANGLNGSWVNSPTIETTAEPVSNYPNSVGYSRYTYFDGVNDVIAIGEDSGDFYFSGSDDWSFEATVVINPSSTFTIAGSFGTGNERKVLIRSLENGKFDVVTNNNGTGAGNQFYEFDGVIADGTPHRFKVSYTGSTLTAEVEGVAVSGSGGFRTSLYNNGVPFFVAGGDDSEGSLEGIVYDTVFTVEGNTRTINGYGADDWGDSVVYGAPDDILIGRDESDIAKDIFGETLQNTGKAKPRGIKRDNNCIELNGSTQYGNTGVTFNGFTEFTVWRRAKYLSTNGFDLEGYFNNFNSVRLGRNTGASGILVNYGLGSNVIIAGTSIPNNEHHSLAITSKAGGESKCYYNATEVDSRAAIITTISNTLPFYIGASNEATDSHFCNYQVYDYKIYDRQLSAEEIEFLDSQGKSGVDPTRDNLVLDAPISEGAGDYSYDISGNDNNITWVNSPAWGTQDVYAANWLNGCNNYMNFDGTGTNNVNLGNSTDFDVTDDLDVTLYAMITSTDNQTFMAKGVRTTTNWSIDYAGGLRVFGYSGGAARGIANDTTVILEPSRVYKIRAKYDGTTWQLFVDDVLMQSKVQAVVLDTNTADVLVGSRSIFLDGFVYDINFNGISAYNGYGADDSDWADTIGSNNGTVTGSPATIRIPANGTVDALGQPVRNLPVLGHNDAEETLDWINTGVGGVAIPETAFLSDMTADLSAFGFNQDISSDDNMFYKHESYADTKHTIYLEDLTGDNITKAEANIGDGGK